MPRDWKGSYSRKLRDMASERGRRMARARWDKFHAERGRLNAIDPVRVGGKIVKRIVVIHDENCVKERTFYEFDRDCDWKRKKRELGL